MKRLRKIARPAAISIAALFAAHTTGLDNIVIDSYQRSYHSVESRVKARQGTAHIYFNNGQTILAAVVIANTVDSDLTEIPVFAFGPDWCGDQDFTLELFDLRTGRYVFEVKLWYGDPNNPENLTKTFEIDVENEGGRKSLRYEVVEPNDIC